MNTRIETSGMEKRTEILRHLRKDARKKLTEISRETGIPVTTVFDHVKALQDSVVIKSVALLDFPDLGYHFNTFFVADNAKSDAIRYLRENARVNNLFLVGDNKAIFEGVFSSHSEKSEFLESIHAFDLELTEHPVYEEIKRESFLP